ncbi:MAG: hypothetical protein CR997_05005 [Acidobacteria bacterium]|nr:MAG: hypothetical protein CR997_05005 [Acidobacteriota bacterium]
MKDIQNHTFRAYLSEPITRCPVREKGRIQRLVAQLQSALKEPPYSTQLYIPSLISDPTVRTHLTPEHVYLLDRIRIVEADYLLVLADHTSFGVGGEVEMATNLGKPIIIFSREKKLSRFLLGTPANAHMVHLKDKESNDETNPYYIQYTNWRDLKTPLLRLVRQVIQSPVLKNRHLPFWDVSSNLKEARKAKGWSKEILAAKAGILLPQLILWEKSLEEIVSELQAYQQAGQLDLDPIELNSSQLELLTNPSLNALHKLSFALGISMNDLLGDETELIKEKGPSRINRQLKTQLIRSREEVLEQRAFQFDVTFREYKALRTIFIANFIETLDHTMLSSAHKLDRIDEQRFHEQLQKLRNLK